MPKKNTNKNDETEDDYEIEENENEEAEIVESDVEIEDEEEELIIDQETEKDTGCAIEDAINDDDEFFDNNEEIELPIENSAEYLNKENRVSVNRLTKYEMVRILGERTKQLTMGAKPLIKNYNNLSYEKIAEEEFKLNMIPYKIKRPLPNGKFEIWTLDELYKDHLLSQLE